LVGGGRSRTAAIQLRSKTKAGGRNFQKEKGALFRKETHHSTACRERGVRKLGLEFSMGTVVTRARNGIARLEKKKKNHAIKQKEGKKMCYGGSCTKGTGIFRSKMVREEESQKKKVDSEGKGERRRKVKSKESVIVGSWGAKSYTLRDEPHRLGQKGGGRKSKRWGKKCVAQPISILFENDK